MTQRTAISFVASPSPNWNERPAWPGTDAPLIDTIVLHYTGMQTAAAALERLCAPESKVSAHFLIEEDGTIHQLVEPRKRAWHAGISFWQGRSGLNDTSIGIEIVNPGHEFGYRRFPDGQIASLTGLLAVLKDEFNIPEQRFVGHSDIAPDRKQDPGELFPWQQLAAHGFGIWADCERNNGTILAKKGMVSVEIASLNMSLRNIGYSVEVGDEFSQATCDALIAFQRHWRPEKVTGDLDQGTQAVLTNIENQFAVKTDDMKRTL